LLDGAVGSVNLDVVKIGSIMPWFSILLWFHILGGSIALLTGPVPMLARKGGALHRKAGRVFWIAIACGSVSAAILAIIIRDRLLLTIAVLTAFLIFSGLRALRFRRGDRPDWKDQGSCAALAGFGIWLLWTSARPTDVTGIFFGLGSLALVARKFILLHSRRPDWLLAHIAGMGGAYVATVTAFVVVNLSFLPEPVIFITPTLIGTSLITWASIRYAARPGGEMRNL
jgi:uncharacterized membrane protein